MSQSLPLLISLRTVTKRFGSFVALDGLDLSVAPGEVHGFLGPNGAGKSTSIRAILGQIRTDGGTLEVFGLDPRRDAVDVHARLAYVPGDTSLWPGLSGGECIDVLGGFQGSMNQRRRDELVDRFDLDPSKRARTYSKGNRQKVALIAALSCEADLFILDEPTSGLDPLMEAVFQQVVAERKAEGAAVLLSSHILAEVETLCDRITIIRGGRNVSTGSLADLRAGTLTQIEATTDRPVRGLDQIPGVTDLELEARPHGLHASFMVTHDDLAATLRLITDAVPSDVAVRPPSLEQLFLEHYHDARTEGSPS